MIEDIWNAAGAFLTWPWLAVCGILAILGVVMTGKVFTAERRLEYGVWWDLLHDTQALHPIFVGGVIGLFWLDPDFDGQDWPRIASAAYFGFAGVVSAFVWNLFVWWVKRQTGFAPRLPGISQPHEESKLAANAATVPPTPSGTMAMEDMTDALSRPAHEDPRLADELEPDSVAPET